MANDHTSTHPLRHILARTIAGSHSNPCVELYLFRERLITFIPSLRRRYGRREQEPWLGRPLDPRARLIKFRVPFTFDSKDDSARLKSSRHTLWMITVTESRISLYVRSSSERLAWAKLPSTWISLAESRMAVSNPRSSNAARCLCLIVPDLDDRLSAYTTPTSSRLNSEAGKYEPSPPVEPVNRTTWPRWIVPGQVVTPCAKSLTLSSKPIEYLAIMSSISALRPAKPEAAESRWVTCHGQRHTR